MLQKILNFYPEISHFEKLKDFDYAVMLNGDRIFGLELDPIDVEASSDFLARLGLIEGVIKGFSSGLRFRFIVDRYHEYGPESEYSRSSALRVLPGVRKRCYLFIEPKKSQWNRFLDQFEVLTQAIQGARGSISPLRESRIKSFIEDGDSEWQYRNGILDKGDRVTGAVRLHKLPLSEVSLESILSSIERIPVPFRIVTTLKKIEKSKAEFRLKGKKNTIGLSGDSTAHLKETAIEDTLVRLGTTDDALVDFEWVAILERTSEVKLKEDLFEAKKRVEEIGTPLVETFGVYPTLMSATPGGDIRIPMKEFTDYALSMASVMGFGSDEIRRPFDKKSLILHRRDGSYGVFDLFHKNHSAFNVLISGKTGAGKSVFGNALSRALLNDPNIHFIKVDVGGSYTRECSLYGGIETSFSMDKPSGMDPFQSLNKNETSDGSIKNEVVSTLSEFVAVLMIEEGESSISKDLRSQIESAVKNYINGFESHSFSSFVDTLPDTFPRKPLLKRWSVGGVFENAFKATEQERPNRYLYFNFENIQGAANKDYTSGIMASVIAKVNLLMMNLSTNEARNAGKRMVFFCDETKFFFDKNGSFFLLTAANFRKFGHSVVLMGQNPLDFFVKTGSGEDMGLVLNSPIKVFYRSALPKEKLMELFGMNEEEASFLCQTGIDPNQGRRFLMQVEGVCINYGLYLTQEEYWSMTSSRAEVDKMQKIQEALPFLQTKQIIQIMSMSGGHN